MIDKKIYEFLEELVGYDKRYAIERMIRKFKLKSKEAEDTYNKWRKNYMKPRL